MLKITAEIHIPISEFDLSYVRSSGPGGQNVNKVNSKAVLRWNIYSSPSLTLDMRGWLLKRLGPQLTSDGDIVISSDRYRDQIRNREDCFDKFQKLLASAAAKPKPRKKTKPSYSSQRKGKEAKHRHSEKKSLRKTSKDYD